MKKNNIQRNVISGWATTIIGIVAMVISLILVWQKVFDFVWEGIGGLSIGTVLLMAPRTIEKAIIEAIRAWGKRGNSYGGYDDENQDRGGDI